VTLTYDCRRSDFFRPHAIGALKLVDQGAITGATKGARHGELGHTQFLPGNALRYGVDADGDGRVDFHNLADALASTANFLRQKGWQPGQGYQEGEPNFAAIQQWNAAGVYQKAIAIMAAQIDLARSPPLNTTPPRKWTFPTSSRSSTSPRASWPHRCGA
jgi:membrane-bound lytic murein transglycosylase B